MRTWSPLLSCESKKRGRGEAISDRYEIASSPPQLRFAKQTAGAPRNDRRIMKTIDLETERRVFSVSEITRNIRFALEQQFSDVWVEGEISGFKFHSSGHMYFSLKDESSQIQCVMFRAENQKLDFELGEGLSILCFGRVSVYPVRGHYQLYIQRIEPKGIGALQLKFQQLKEKLKTAGFFDEARKRPIPYLPGRIGVVTSPDGAALRDILQILDRRFSNAHVIIYPVPVQGPGAAELIAQGIRNFNEWEGVDVMIVGRGGGSLEDLWAFNEEIVAQAIFDSKIPVISAVGHEVDFTIADFVADLRAPTPSAAAEMVMPLKEEMLLTLSDFCQRLSLAFSGLLKNLRQELKRLSESAALKNPLGIFEAPFQRLDELKKNMAASFETFLKFKEEKLSFFIGKLEALGPLATLKRGFSVSLKLPEEKVITSFDFVKAGDYIKTKLSRGFFISEVKETSL